MQTVLVTGCAGFIGSVVCMQLLSGGCKVIGVDNMNDYYDVTLKELRLRGLLGRNEFSFVKGDIEDGRLIDALMRSGERIDVVYNLAARAGVRYSLQNPHVYMTTNLIGTLNILEAMRRNNVPKMVLASTSSLYAGQVMPYNEDLSVNTPISPYAASKKAAEALAYSYFYLYGVSVSVVRYFTVYGPAGRPDMGVFRFIKWIDSAQPIELYGDGSQGRDFTYVDDIARGTILSSAVSNYEVINLGGGGSPVQVADLIDMIAKKIGKKAIVKKMDFHRADVDSTWANIDKAKRLIGWEPKVSLSEGLDRSIEWYFANKDLVQTMKL